MDARAKVMFQVCDASGKGEDSFRLFQFAGYGDPNEAVRFGNHYVAKLDESAESDVWYVNTAGYAQKLNPQRPPLSVPCEVRVLLIPLFEE